MSAGQLVIIPNEVSSEPYGVIVQVLSGNAGNDSYIVLVGEEMLILSGEDIAAI